MNEPSQVPERRFCSTHSSAWSQCAHCRCLCDSAAPCNSPDPWTPDDTAVEP